MSKIMSVGVTEALDPIQLSEAEARVQEAKSWNSAYAATLDAAELCLQALKLTGDARQEQLLNEKCGKLLDQAERIKCLKEWPLISNGNPRTGEHKSEQVSTKKLKQPVSTRKLSTREQIILLQGSKLHGCVFPPWKDPPASEEFALTGAELFTDNTEFRFGVDQLGVFDGWRRPSEVLTVEGLKADGQQEASIRPTMIPKRTMDLVQDMTCDCSVVASLCAGTARAELGHSKIFSSMVYPYDFVNMKPAMSPNGKYIFKLNFNGCSRKVTVDDCLPASRTERSLHVLDRNNPGLLWPALLEKAYLKVRGGYDFPGSNSGTDLLALIGWIPEQLILQSDDIIPHIFWRRILNAFKYGDVLMTIGTGKLTRREEQGMGLASEHDYAIINLTEEDDRRLFLIKNPWSECSSWKGKEDRNQKAYSAPDTLAYSRQSEEMLPGTFWMDLEEVLQSFETIYLSWNPGLFPYRQDVHFSWDLTANREANGSFDRSPQYVIHSSENGSVWLLLSRHFVDLLPATGDQKTDGIATTGFLSLYAFEADGYRVVLSDGCLLKSPYVDAPNTLLRFELPKNSRYTIVVSEQDLPSWTYNFTLSAFSLNPLEITLANNKYSHSVVQHSAWTFSTAGGNASSPNYHKNPQFSLTLPSSSDLAIFLEGENGDVPVHVKLLWANGKRLLNVTTQDIVGDSCEYRRGSALASISEVKAGTYTVICSTFEEGQRCKFSLTVRSMAECVIKSIPLEEAGRHIFKAPSISFSEGSDRFLTPLHVTRITRLRLQARLTGSASSRTPLRVSLEYGQGPDKQVLTITGNGTFLDVLAGLWTDDVDILPRMCESCGVWIVIERIGGSYVQPVEQVQVEILSDHAVEVGPWGKEVDEPIESR